MAKIVHRDLFGWNSVRGMPDLERFSMVLEALDDEEFVVKLERLRGNGRNDYAVRPMWNSILVFPLTGHCTWAAFRRELGRNRDLMAVCGFLHKLSVPVGLALSTNGCDSQVHSIPPVVSTVHRRTGSVNGYTP